MRLTPSLALICLPFVASAAFAADPEPAETPAPTEEKAEKSEKKAKKAKEEKKICRRIAADMSSRRRTKVCKTREEWKEYNKQ